MPELYFFVSKEKIEDVIDCGLKLTEWYDRELTIPGSTYKTKVIRAFLNPRDNKEKVNDTKYQCLRLKVGLDYCSVADSHLYALGLENPRFMELYYKAMVPLQDYSFGTYRSPEVLVTTSILPEYIEVTGRSLDIPLLYENSESLYLENRMQQYEETYKDSGNLLLYSFYKYLESEGRVRCYEDNKKENCIFYNTETMEYIVLKMP